MYKWSQYDNFFVDWEALCACMIQNNWMWHCFELHCIVVGQNNAFWLGMAMRQFWRCAIIAHRSASYASNSKKIPIFHPFRVILLIVAAATNKCDAFIMSSVAHTFMMIATHTQVLLNPSLVKKCFQMFTTHWYHLQTCNLFVQISALFLYQFRLRSDRKCDFHCRDCIFSKGHRYSKTNFHFSW